MMGDTGCWIRDMIGGIRLKLWIKNVISTDPPAGVREKS